MDLERAIKAEQSTISQMIGLYCREKHGQTAGICAECSALEAYAHRQLENCQFMPDKPVCAKCPVHCYKSPARQQIREVMKYAGPRMLTHAPISAIQHLWQLIKPESARVKQVRERMEEISSRQ